MRHIGLFAAGMTIFLFLAYAFSSSAQNKTGINYEIRAGIGGFPLSAMSYYEDGSFDVYDDNFCSSPWSLNSIYDSNHGRVYSTGTITAEFAMVFSKRFTLSFNLGINHFWTRSYTNLSQKHYRYSRSNAFYILPEARLSYLNHPRLKLYYSFGLGFGFYNNFKEMKKEDNAPVSIELQTVPIGIAIGGKTYGFAELGLGTMFFGGRVGIGYRF
jgi:hypothetical protein